MITNILFVKGKIYFQTILLKKSSNSSLSFKKLQFRLLLSCHPLLSVAIKSPKLCCFTLNLKFIFYFIIYFLTNVIKKKKKGQKIKRNMNFNPLIIVGRNDSMAACIITTKNSSFCRGFKKCCYMSHIVAPFRTTPIYEIYCSKPLDHRNRYSLLR